MGQGQVVAEGRDAGSQIYPEAELKVFLTASPEERAKRRYIQLKEEGIEDGFEEILKAIIERDERDKHRPLYPYKPAEGATIIDTTGLSPEEVVEKILSLVEEKV